MRIGSSSIQLAGAGTSVERQTKDESLKMWIGNSRPVFADENPAGLIVAPETATANDSSGVTLNLSAEGKAALEKQMAAAAAGNIEEEDELSELISDKDKQKILMLEKMIEALTGKRIKFVLPDIDGLEKIKANAQVLQSGGQLRSAAVQQPSGWGMEYDLHETYYEKQTMGFSAEGIVKTADGREISIDLELSMSREFSSRLDMSVRAGDAVRKVDPLVVNFSSPAAKLTNNKFSFDIDADGDDDQISFATGGSGFLAFDANNDGTINNGSELFGPQSGNGFNDLAQYDSDSNGWIDENDDIYSKLRIWTKDENGNDQLFALGAKGIGAIYLGNVATNYDLKTGSNQELGSIARSGIYLRENGLAGTIQHVDLAL
ncbi:MAG: hypothetical protein ABFD25_10710 [Clostridiaceae bacterium]